MTRQQLEHVIRAAAATANVREIVVIGSQSILGSFAEPPIELTVSMEADVFPKEKPARSIVIDGAIGELSQFHETFGYYAHGVDDTTATLPEGWEDRLVRVENANTSGAIGWCLEPHDLAVSKLAAGREKDFRFVETMIRKGLVQASSVIARLLGTSAMSEQSRERAMEYVRSFLPAS